MDCQLLQADIVDGNFFRGYQPPKDRLLDLAWVIDGKEQAMLMLNGRQLLGQLRFAKPLPKGRQLLIQANSTFPPGIGEPGTFAPKPSAWLLSGISEWGGRIESLTNAPPAGLDSVVLHDLTVMDGTLVGVRDGQMELTVNGVKTNAPLSRVGRINFSSTGRPAAPPSKDTVRVYLADADQLTLTSPRYEERAVSGMLAGIVPVTLPVTSIVRMELASHNLDRTVNALPPQK